MFLSSVYQVEGSSTAFGEAERERFLELMLIPSNDFWQAL